MAVYANEAGPTAAAKAFGVHHSTAQYWQKKLADPNFHGNDWGGNKTFKYGEDGQTLFEHTLWSLLKECNNLTLKEMADVCTERSQLPISVNMVHRQLKNWKFSKKVAFPIQRAKYTVKNIEYYAQYVLWFFNLPTFLNVKVLDESHFDGRKLQARKKVWSAKNDKNNAQIAFSDLSENYSITAMISLAEQPLYFDIRMDSNTQYDWAEFIYGSVKNGYLRNGDILIMDNAAVHTGTDTLIDVLDFLEERNIAVRLLPTYSPELSPIELVFGMIKNHIRHRRTEKTLAGAIFEAIALTVDTNSVKSAFHHVLMEFLHNPMTLPPEYVIE